MKTYDEKLETAFDDFIEHLTNLEQLQKKFSDAWKTTALASAKDFLCPTCLTDLRSLKASQRYTTYLVPLTAGGPKTFQNTVVMCASCAKKRGTADITDPSFTSRLSAPLPEDTLTRRREILLKGENHLTSTWPMAPREKVRALLEKRFNEPRFRVFAHGSPFGCFVGYRRHRSEPQAYAGASAMLRHVHKGELTERGDLVIFTLARQEFLTAVWALIEMNGLVKPVDMEGMPCDWNDIDQYDWRKCWREIYDSFDDNRRRYRTRQAVQPWAPKVYSENKDTVRSRNRGDRLLKEKNLRRLELRQARILDESVTRWTTPEDPGYQFRPPFEIIMRTDREAHYWRLSPNERRIFCLDNPTFTAPSLEPSDDEDL